MSAAVLHVAVLFRTVITQRKLIHGRVGTVIRQLADNCVARSALGTGNIGITPPAISFFF